MSLKASLPSGSNSIPPVSLSPSPQKSFPALSNLHLGPELESTRANSEHMLCRQEAQLDPDTKWSPERQTKTSSPGLQNYPQVLIKVSSDKRMREKEEKGEDKGVSASESELLGGRNKPKEGGSGWLQLLRLRNGGCVCVGVSDHPSSEIFMYANMEGLIRQQRLLNSDTHAHPQSPKARWGWTHNEPDPSFNGGEPRGPLSAVTTALVLGVGGWESQLARGLITPRHEPRLSSLPGASVCSDRGTRAGTQIHIVVTPS